jgi:hypothetical protein
MYRHIDAFVCVTTKTYLQGGFSSSVTWEVLPQTGIGARLSIYGHIRIFKPKVLVLKNLFSTKHIVWL